MNENIRTEAEKVLTEKGMNCAKLRNTFTLDGNDDSFLDRIVNAMQDFHAQQLEKPVERLKAIAEACPKGSFFRKELSKVLKELETTQTL
jgi:hypothetical protein